MTIEIADMIRDHQAAVSLRRKAEIEEMLWALLSPAERKQHINKSRYLKRLMGGSERQYGERGYLLNQDVAVVAELWRRIDQEKMPVSTATRLHREARANAKLHKIEIADALYLVLSTYDTMPIRHTSGGPIRAHTSTKIAITQTKTKAINGNGDRNPFWSELRELIHKHLLSQLAEGEIVEVDVIWRAFETDIKVVINEFQNKLHRLRTQQHEERAPIKQARLRAACQTLHMDPPRRGKPLNLALAKRQKRVLARAYHPDANKGDEAMRTQYDMVLDAFRICEEWCNQQRGDNND